MRGNCAKYIFGVILAATNGAYAQSPQGSAVTVTVENFVRAETDGNFSVIANKQGGFAKFFHRRDLTSPGGQLFIYPNHDTLYSLAVFDLDAGAVTISLPDAGDRFMSMQVIDEDHYTQAVVYGTSSHTFTREKIGTRYIVAIVRTLVDPANPKDVEAVHVLQDAIKISQNSPGRFEIPNWDQANLKKLHDALLVLGQTVPDTKRMFGAKDQVDPVRHLIGTASGWGGNPEKDAFYVVFTPGKNDGTVMHRLNVKGVPVEGFWSVTVYNAEGALQPNPYNAYSVNNITAKKSNDGAAVVQFGGCDGKVPNCLPIMKGWKYVVRLYRPYAEILDGTWKFPEAQPVN